MTVIGLGIITICEDGTVASANVSSHNALRLAQILASVQAQLLVMAQQDESDNHDSGDDDGRENVD